ncbi:MAG: D-alanyl-D-alanine carboxypeptidase/D-alanyl-D-alanine-endopeptidase [Sterolibacterium sp.]|nr:D-alanyl-D-alanine carboxypeptidase/D-alanyl-D-alanine-endopeptidase [Sterolibacterium sp.]
MPALFYAPALQSSSRLLPCCWPWMLACWLSLSFPALAQPAEAARLPEEVRQALHEAHIPFTEVAVIVQPVDDAQHPTLQLNGERPLNPASLMKLLTTYAALELLGPAYTWHTTLLTERLPQDGVLNSDLILRGTGDPALTLERFWLLLHRLRARGVRDLQGNLILDRHIFDSAGIEAERHPPFDDQPLRPYNVLPDALLLNFKAINLQLAGDPAQGTLTLLPEPLPANLDIINQITPAPPIPDNLRPGLCLQWKKDLQADYQPAKTGSGSESSSRARLVLKGHYPIDCGSQVWRLAPQTHPEYLQGVFTQLWYELGGTLRGTVANRTLPPDSALTVLADVESPPLASIVRDLNKFSNNVMARQLFLALGQKAEPPPDGRGLRPQDGARAIRQWLARKPLNFPELVLDNGAGLSRQERLSAASLARLLDSAWQSPVMPEFVSALSIAGVDGTLKKRLAGEPLVGRSRLKTGSLDGVSGLAGYLLDQRGHWQIVVFLVNHPNAANSHAVQDALLRWVYRAAE